MSRRITLSAIVAALIVLSNCTVVVTSSFAQAVSQNQVSESQSDWYEKYKTQENVPKPEEMALNTDQEPDLEEGFVSLFDGETLDGWKPLGGTCTFEVADQCIVGTCVPGSESTYLSTERDDYSDFIFTCDIKWEVDGNTGVMFRGQVKSTKKNPETVFGPQAEMEGLEQGRGWSGGIYGQSCGGYFYPLWLDAHEEVRNALVADGWNRITVSAKGDVVKTWVNGIPAAHWVGDETYQSGFFSLQIHKGKKGKVHFRNLKVKELN